MVERWIVVVRGNGGGRRRERTRGRNQGRSKGGTRFAEAGNSRETSGASGKDIRSEEDSLERRTTRGSPQEDPTTPHRSKLSWALQWLPDDDPRPLLSLLKRAMQEAWQSWHSMWQASAKSLASLTSTEAPPSTDFLALHQLLQKSEMALAVQLQTRRNGLNDFSYQARVTFILSPLCSCGLDHQTAKHIIIHCHDFLAAGHALRDDLGHLPDYKQLVTTLTGIKKVTRWVIEKGTLGQYKRARVPLYPPGPSSSANN